MSHTTSVAKATRPSRAQVDEVLAAASRERRRRRHRWMWQALLVPIAITAVWAVYVTATDRWAGVVDHFDVAVTMVFGSFVAGSTPQGGGAVAFPVLSKVLETPAEVARSFSLFIQTVGMGAAAATILVRRRPIDIRAVVIGTSAAVVGMIVGLVVLGDPDTLFWSSRLPGAYVKVTFTVVVVAMAFVTFVGTRRPAVEVSRSVPLENRRLVGALVVAGVLGGITSSLVGSGADVLVYLAVVLFSGVDPRVGVPTSVITMAIVSTFGFVVLGIADGQLAVDPAAVGLDPQRFDVFGFWLAAVPIVAWGAPLGAMVAGRMRARTLVAFVAVLASIELVSTILFVDTLRSDPALAAYGAVAVITVLGGLALLSRHRRRAFRLAPFDPTRTLRRGDVEFATNFGRP